MNMKKIACLLLAVLMVVGLFAGCGAEDVSTEAASAPENVSAQPDPTKEVISEEQEPPVVGSSAEEANGDASTVELEEEISVGNTGFTPVAYEFPLVETPETLSYFCTISPNFSAYMETYSTNEAVIALEEMTGVHIEYQCYIPENAQTQFNLLAASGALPDITLGATEYYSGGLDRAVQDEILLNLADYLNYCPNYSQLLDQDSEMKNSLTTDSGNLVGFAAYSDPSISMPVNGCIMVRGDWLEQVGKEVPTTYDGVYDVLTAFKNDLGKDTPMIVTSYLDDQSGSFASGYGIKAFFMTSPGIQVPFYVVDGTVKCAIVEDDFVSYVEMLQGYMADGLTAKDVESYTNEMSYQDKVTSGEAGFFWGFGVNSLETLNEQVEEGGYFVAVPAIRKTEDQTLHFTSSADYQARYCVNLTTNCSNIELACKWLDCHFTEEVSMLSMYGVEGISYELDEDGNPQFTDLMLNNPDGMTLDTAKALYTLSPADNVSYNYINTDLATYSTEQVKALELINSGKMDGACVYPTGASLTAEEDEVYSALIADLSTYMAEHVLKFVTGEESIADYSAFVETLYEMGMQDAIDLQQTAYDRYLSR